MKPTHKALAKNGTYTTREGTEKTRWHRCGPVWQKESGGFSVRLESLPVAFDGELLIVVDDGDDKPRQDTQQRRPQRRTPGEDDEIAF